MAQKNYKQQFCASEKIPDLTLRLTVFFMLSLACCAEAEMIFKASKIKTKQKKIDFDSTSKKEGRQKEIKFGWLNRMGNM